MNNNVWSLQLPLLQLWSTLLESLFDFIPRLVFAVLVWLLGMMLASFGRTIVRGIVRAVDLSKLTKNSALEAFLTRAEIKLKLEDVLGQITKYAILYVFLIIAVNALGLNTLGMFLTNILSYIPRVFSATFILALGVLLAGFVESFVKGVVGNVDLATGRLLGKAASYVVVVFASMAGIAELGIAETLINTLYIGFIASLAIGFGIALGFGAKDVVATVINNWYKKITK